VLRLILLGATIVVAFDALASLLLPLVGGSLLWMFMGETLVYCGTGVAASRLGGFWKGARGGAGVAAIDATIGWGMTWAIGTGRISELTPVNVTIVFTAMVSVGALAGGIGALLGRLARRPSVAS
jgi:hypothetical protein